MVIDTSALIAILLSEEEAPRLVSAIAAVQSRLLPAPALVEAAAVMLHRTGPQGELAIDALVARMGLSVEPLSEDAARAARRGYALYGKGVGSPGVLNFGDCLVYGAAKALDEPLLFTGEDFARTDLRAAEY